MKLKEGDKAPEINTVDQNGQVVTLAGLRGSKVILYFYPKDNTPGCNAEACNLRDNYDALRKKGFVVVGVSADTATSHQKFITRFDLPFALLPDTEKQVIQDYGAWGPKKFMGRSYEGILRTTFVIDEEGIISKIITKVKTKDHTAQILEELGM